MSCQSQLCISVCTNSLVKNCFVWNKNISVSRSIYWITLITLEICNKIQMYEKRNCLRKYICKPEAPYAELSRCWWTTIHCHSRPLNIKGAIVGSCSSTISGHHSCCKLLQHVQPDIPAFVMLRNAIIMLQYSYPLAATISWNLKRLLFVYTWLQTSHCSTSKLTQNKYFQSHCFLIWFSHLH